MCPLSVHESLSGSVMTKRSGGKVQLNRNLSQPQLRIQCSVHSSNRPPRSSPVKNVSPAYTPDPIVVEKSPTQHGSSPFSFWRFRSASWLDVLTQVGKLRVRCLLVLLLVLSLQCQSVMCKVWHTEQPRQITFKSRLCRPVSQEDLKSRMGKSFDEGKMATDGTSAKRQFGDTDGYQGDDPYAGYDLEDVDTLEDTYLSSDELWLREEDIYADDNMYNGISHKKDGFDFDRSVQDGEGKEKKNSHGVDEDDSERTHAVRRSWVPRRSILGSHRRDEGRRNDFPELGFADDKTNSKVDKTDLSNKYMRRRRRRRSLLRKADPRAPRSGPRGSHERDSINSRDKSRNDKSLSKSLKKSSDVNLTLQLILSGRKRTPGNRKLRKQLKKEFRQRARKQNKPPPWQCKFRHRTKFMKVGVFPRVLRDGRCMTDKCFYRLYNCEPIKYAIKLLQRDPNQCNPLPLEGNGTVYEERWNLISSHITVGCNCASLAESSRSKNRRKN